MKKVLVLIGAAVLIMALATPSMAQFKSWGHMEFQTVWVQNQGLQPDPDDEIKTRYITERFRFYLQYGDPKTVRAVLGFEADGNNWGTPLTGRNEMTRYQTDQVALEVKWAFLEFVIPQTPLTAMVGMNWWAYGDRLFQGADAPGVKLTANFAPHKVEAFWWREEDNSRTTYNVNDVYGLEYRFTQKQFNLDAYFAYQNDLSNATFSEHPWFAGIGAGFRPGNFDFAGRFSYVGGERDFAAADDVDYEAWAAELKARYQIGPGMFVGAEGFYSTGNDADDTSSFKRFRSATNSESRSGFGNWRSVFFYANSGTTGSPGQAGRDLEFGGTWYGNVNFEYSPTAWARFILNYLYIGDTSKGDPANVATGGIINSGLNARQDQDEDFIGHEINLITTLTIYKAFQYTIALAYFKPGEVFDTATADAKDAYGIYSRLIYSF